MFGLSGGGGGVGKFNGSVRDQRLFADIAGHHERAAGGAEPVIDSGYHIGIDQPVKRIAGSVLADRYQWQRPDHQIGIRKRPRRRWNQPRAGRRRLQQAGYQWRRYGQPRRIVGGVQGSRQGRPSPRSYRWFRASGDSSDPGSTNASSADPLLQALQAASSTSVTGSSGTTTTSPASGNGSQAAATSAVSSTSSTAASLSYSNIEQMIQREASAISFSANPLSFNA